VDANLSLPPSLPFVPPHPRTRSDALFLGCPLIMKEAGLVNSDPGEGEEGTYVCSTCVFGMRLSCTQPPPSLLRFAKWGGW
jgi:hypothetical protein